MSPQELGQIQDWERRLAEAGLSMHNGRIPRKHLSRKQRKRLRANMLHKPDVTITTSPEPTGHVSARTGGLYPASSQMPKGKPAGSTPRTEVSISTTRIAPGVVKATPRVELRGGRGIHQNAPQVSAKTEKATAPRV